MRGEIITIGDELITGRVCDVNSFFLSARVSSLGLRIEAISSVGDDPNQIKDVLARAVERSEFVLVTGGLGPTADDITANVAAEFFGRPLILNEDFLRLIQEYLEERNMPWVEAFRKMAYVPEGAFLIDPQVACGFFLYRGKVPVYFLPGIPSEVRVLAETRVIPLILGLGGERDVVRQRLIKVFGLPEAQIGQDLHGLETGEPGVMIGFYPNFPENHITITVRASTPEQADSTLARVEAEIDRRIGPFIIAKDAATIEETVGRLLTDRGWIIAVAESCTGGLISHRLTSVSGSSKYFDRGLVVYSNQAKHELLGVPVATLEQYGAVSAETALALATGVKDRSRTDLGLSVTGIAGPTGGSGEKPVGTVFMAIAGPSGHKVERLKFSGRRDQVTILTAQTALTWLKRYLSDDTFLHRPGT